MAMIYGVRPSNGTEGSMQRAQCCARCTVDHDGGWHDEDIYDANGDSCPIILEALMGPSGPPEWGHDFETGKWVCTKFSGPCECHA